MAAASVSNELPPDFLLYLEARWGVRREVALAALGESLQHYQPVERRSIRILRPPGALITGSEPGF